MNREELRLAILKALEKIPVKDRPYNIKCADGFMTNEAFVAAVLGEGEMAREEAVIRSLALVEHDIEGVSNEAIQEVKDWMGRGISAQQAVDEIIAGYKTRGGA